MLFPLRGILNAGDDFMDMKLTREQYAHLVKRHSPPSKLGTDVWRAFVIGGLICCVGQGLGVLYRSVAGLDEELSATAVSITLVGLSAFATGLGWYDDLARVAGAGTLVPITGFANAVVSPALEFRTEGFILGTAAKLFTIAGPVIAFGVGSSIVYGLVLWVLSLF